MIPADSVSKTAESEQKKSQPQHNESDVLVVGSGIAGLAAALAAVQNDAGVTIITKSTRPEGASSWWAQGGIAIARQNPEQFKQDIINASSGTADPDAVDILVENANAAVEEVLLETLDIEFDLDDRGEFDFGREAAHSDNRVLHVDASTGRHIYVPFLNYLDNHDNIEIVDDTAALELIRHEGRVHGAVLESDNQFEPHYAGSVVLATGGIGDLYSRSTNPQGSTGDGIAMAALAGANVTDMEYVQFHPTVCLTNNEPFLISEAVRGEGAVLRNGNRERFMPTYHDDADLAPRDIVARAVKTERETTGDVMLDVTALDFKDEFPNLAERCAKHGVDWTEGIPVAPAEHFLCGGITVDNYGRTSLDHLYAVGECARTGVHGANRLASTSLLEGLVWGRRAGEDAANSDITIVEPPELLDQDPRLPANFAQEKLDRLHRVMDEYVGLERDTEDLQRAMAVFRRLKGEVDAYTRTRTSRSLYELRSATVTALLIARQATENDTSVGCHQIHDELSSDSKAVESITDD
ncbi:aspartate oxidase [halophilic archaeon]|nr:aspartate oxidase [halophilic archaeon]